MHVKENERIREEGEREKTKERENSGEGKIQERKKIQASRRERFVSKRE